jgi:hypothetical protein
MKRLAPSTGWMRALAALGLALVLHAASPARAEVWRGPAAQAGPTLPLHGPPAGPGTPRLIRIGPQALVSVDEHGRARMVDESPPPPNRARSALGLAAALGLFGGAAFLMLEGRPGATLDVGGARVP